MDILSLSPLAPMPVYAEVLASWNKATGFAFHVAGISGLHSASYFMEANPTVSAWRAAYKPDDRLEISPILDRHTNDEL